MHADDTEKNSHLMELKALGPLEIFLADLDDEGSFDDAVAGCDYAFLVAAPVNIITSDNPEVRGTQAACLSVCLPLIVQIRCLISRNSSLDSRVVSSCHVNVG